MIIDHRENLQLIYLFFSCVEMVKALTQPVSGQWTFMMTPEIACCLPFERHSSEKSLAKTMPRNDLPMSNLMLNNSRVQFILTASKLFDSIGGLLDQQPCKYKISI